MCVYLHRTLSARRSTQGSNIRDVNTQPADGMTTALGNVMFCEKHPVHSYLRANNRRNHVLHRTAGWPQLLTQLSLDFQDPKAEVGEAMLYAGATRTPHRGDFKNLFAAHHKFLPQ